MRRLDLVTLATLLQAAPPEVAVELHGDPDALPGAAAGASFADVVAWGRVPVRDRRRTPAGSLGALLSGIRAGTLQRPDPDDRSAVVVTCADDAEVAHRAGQVVGISLPRSLGIDPAEESVVVVSPLHAGVAGVDALTAQLAGTGVRVCTVHELADTAERAGDPDAPTPCPPAAVVLCLPGSAGGVLSRGLVGEAVRAAGRQLTIVTSAGPALPAAVRDVAQHPPRRTRLLALLREAGEGI